MLHDQCTAPLVKATGRAVRRRKFVRCGSIAESDGRAALGTPGRGVTREGGDLNNLSAQSTRVAC
jgi:hypothetical protein